ncbi:bile acid:sodium symporter family protein [Breznakiella homolactica]|uniref:Bile acid:sodium symporter family protein n=1 Tax=Breznakiella homolactica TaxID=2798577 RepID=A0A7T7XND4_9SPIR|nr:bile acid:sodium symporter family protein [Breznakiella homolactica]QQO09432.1 bile acid:sodium symporter family protein [Breznakiella homolactica]
MVNCNAMEKPDRPAGFLNRCNTFLDRIMPVLTPGGVVLGFILGERIAPLKPLVTYLFAFITLTGAMGLDIADFKRVLKNPLPLAAVFVCSHVLLPAFAFLAASLLFPGQPDIATGYILLTATPTAVASYIWTSIYYGSGAVSLTVILLDTLLAPLVTPAVVGIFADSNVNIDTRGMIISLFSMVVIPSVIGVMANHFSKKKVQRSVVPYCRPLSKIALLAVVAINTSQVAHRISFDSRLLKIIFLNIVITVGGYLLGYAASCGLRVRHDTKVAMTFGTGMRNISAAMVLVISFFPHDSAVPVITGIVLQQMLAAFMGYLLFAGKRKTAEGVSGADTD